MRRAPSKACALLISALAVACASTPSGGLTTGSSSTGGTTAGGTTTGGTTTGGGTSSGTGDFSNCTATNASLTATVIISNFAFQPSCIAVAAGTSVTFTNDDEVAHTVTALQDEDEAFDSGNLAQGATFRHTFRIPGTSRSHCAIHPAIQMTVLVQ
ncbi:MAG TPA: plastocyanin/azurin family copper-binding protein [Myxococcota bacterium]|nr:plastocyanin/azurin family copper-binding protein [Myxococcota bacterium]